ncbi:DUF6479 family protein [Kitasatospora sp. NPDC015120]|uniref:DUF6479 family protein n=1 Tax=Kitasatospora sp. NPDC015120 TaxID=3364023 RepID=UPI0036F47FA0
MSETTASLAAGLQGPVLFVTVLPAVLVVGALLAAFVWGSRRRARKQPPPVPLDAVERLRGRDDGAHEPPHRG